MRGRFANQVSRRVILIGGVIRRAGRIGAVIAKFDLLTQHIILIGNIIAIHIILFQHAPCIVIFPLFRVCLRPVFLLRAGGFLLHLLAHIIIGVGIEIFLPACDMTDFLHIAICIDILRGHDARRSSIANDRMRGFEICPGRAVVIRRGFLCDRFVRLIFGLLLRHTV